MKNEPKPEIPEEVHWIWLTSGQKMLCLSTWHHLCKMFSGSVWNIGALSMERLLYNIQLVFHSKIHLCRCPCSYKGEKIETWTNFHHSKYFICLYLNTSITYGDFCKFLWWICPYTFVTPQKTMINVTVCLLRILFWSYEKRQEKESTKTTKRSKQ